MKILSSYLYRADERGLFLGISQEQWIQEINYIETVAGVVRGNHYHTETWEVFFIIDGRVRVVVYHMNTENREEHFFEKGGIFFIEPYEVHTFYTLADAKWINMLSKPLKEEDPDFQRYEVPLIKP